MRFESYVALRYLFALRKQSFISVISLFAVLGVALGVAALIVVIGVMNGFTHDLRDKILGVNAHVYVGSLGGAIKNPAALEQTVLSIPDVTAATGFVYSEVMLSAPGGVKGLVLRGIKPEQADSVFNLSEVMVNGSVADLGRTDPFPGIIVGYQLSKRLGLHPGAMVNLLSPTGKKSAAGFTPKVSTFTVAGVFRTGMFEYDTSLGYVSVDSARKLLGFEGEVVTALELKVKDPEEVGPVMTDLREKLMGNGVYAQSWQEMNANLFAALKLEKTAMFIILSMIVLVGSFSIVTTLVMLVTQKTRDIAVLMSMGATGRGIRKIFMLQGTLIGVVGTILGYALGIPTGFLLKKYQFIKLPQDVYPVDYLPVRMDAPDLALIGIAAMLLCFLSTLYPASKASRLNPADALRYE